jgi:hypothetical protein
MCLYVILSCYYLSIVVSTARLSDLCLRCIDNGSYQVCLCTIASLVLLCPV